MFHLEAGENFGSARIEKQQITPNWRLLHTP